MSKNAFLEYKKPGLIHAHKRPSFWAQSDDWRVQGLIELGFGSIRKRSTSKMFGKAKAVTVSHSNLPDHLLPFWANPNR